MTRGIQPVETDEQYEAALEIIEKIFESGPPAPDSSEGQRLSGLIKLVELYEDENHPIGPSDPADIIRHELERLELTQKELSTKTGIPESRISDLVNGKREPTKSQVVALSEFFGISADLLLTLNPNPSPRSLESSRLGEGPTQGS